MQFLNISSAAPSALVLNPLLVARSASAPPSAPSQAVVQCARSQRGPGRQSCARQSSRAHSVPNPAGATATGSSLGAAENNHDNRIAELG
jgi:hypothetical protein